MFQGQIKFSVMAQCEFEAPTGTAAKAALNEALKRARSAFEAEIKDYLNVKIKPAINSSVRYVQLKQEIKKW